jgi:LacI family transcriptional regulator
LSAIQRLGLKIPDEIALVVFDDLPTFRLLRPSISAVRQPTFEIGQQAMRLLMKQMDNFSSSPHETVVLPTQLIVRESV